MPQNADSVICSPRFPARDIKEAIEELEPMLGKSATKAMENNLEFLGLQLRDDDATISVVDLETAVNYTLGNEAAIMIVRYMLKALFEEKNSISFYSVKERRKLEVFGVQQLDVSSIVIPNLIVYKKMGKGLSRFG